MINRSVSTFVALYLLALPTVAAAQTAKVAIGYSGISADQSGYIESLYGRKK